MERTIRVTGRGRLSLKPDTVRLRIELEDFAKEYEESIRKSAESTKEVQEAFMALGFERSELKTTGFDVNARYEYYKDKKTGNQKSCLIGYTACHILKIELGKDNDLLGKVLYMVSKLSAEPEIKIEYTVKDAEGAKNELLAKAIADSKEKALVLTAAADVKLCDIINIDYSWGQINFVSSPKGNLAKSVVVSDSFDFDIEPEDINVEDTVTVIWSIS